MEAVNSIEQETKAQRKRKNGALRLVNEKLTNIRKKERKKTTKERKGKRLVKTFLKNDIRNLNEGPYQEYPKKHF